MASRAPGGQSRIFLRNLSLQHLGALSTGGREEHPGFLAILTVPHPAPRGVILCRTSELTCTSSAQLSRDMRLCKSGMLQCELFYQQFGSREQASSEPSAPAPRVTHLYQPLAQAPQGSQALAE